MYSGVPITQAGSIKRAGMIFTRIQKKRAGSNKSAGWKNGNFLYRNGSKQGRILRNLINEQALLRASRLEKKGFFS